MMGDGPMWEPSTKKEVTYYDKLFSVVDRDKSGTLDGNEAVQFLAHSGLTQTQLKDVWSVANSPGQAVLQRQAFYVAMRAVALAQSGEASLTRQRIRETSTEPIAMATFKGMPAPPFKLSKGKKPQATQTTKGPSKTASKKTAIAGKTPTNVTAGPKKTAKADGTGNSAQKRKAPGASSGKHGEGDKRVVKASEKTKTNGVAADTTKTKKMSPAKTINKSDTDDGSSSSSPDSDEDGDDSSHSGGEETGNDGGDDEDGASRASSDSGNARTNRGGAIRSESGHGSSDSEGSFEGKKGHQKRNSRGGGEYRNGDERGSDSDNSSISGSGSDSSAGSSKSVDDDGDDDGGSASVVGNDGIRSRSSSSSSSFSASSSSSSEEEGPDPFTMSEKARARYQVIFSKVDASGKGSLSGKQVLGLCAKSGLDKAVLATIWRLSDLDEDGSLSAEEFGIAFHLIFCGTQRKLEVPDELPRSLWPVGYVPPSVLARREEEERKRQKEEQERRRKEEIAAAKTCETSTNATAVDTTKKKKKRQKKTAGADEKEKGNKTAGGLGGNKKTQEEREQEERKEKAAREAASLQKKEELAKKRAEKNAKNKNKRTRTGNNLLAAAAASKPPPAGKDIEASPPTTVEKTNAEADTSKQPPKNEGAPRVDDAEAAVAAAAAPRSDASGAPSSVGEDGVTGRNNSGTPTKKKNKKKRQQPPVLDVPSSMAERSDVDGSGELSAPETAAAVRPLTMAERGARKAEARAAKIEAARIKKETEARDARVAELDLQDGSKTFTIKAMDPMETPDNSGSIHMLSDPSGGGDGGPLSFARLSTPLPYLTPHPGRSPCLQLQEFSVSFPSGIRSASSLTPSLDIRLGPPPAPVTNNEGETGNGVGAADGLIRCPECAEFLASDQIVQHIRSTCRLLPCTLCARLLLPADRERHLEEACPNRRRSCTRCGEAVILSEFARHEKEGGCPRRVVPCAACGAFCFADELTGHQATECPERKVRCPSCGDALPARLMAEHIPSLCRSTTWKCGCGEGPFPLVDRPGHLRTCDAFIDAWEASIEKVIARMPKIEVIRNIGKVMIATRVENPGIALLALAESKGVASLAARTVNDSKSYIDEMCLAADIVNVEVFLRALKKPGKRGSGALWRTGI